MTKDKAVIPQGLYCYTIKDNRQVTCPYWSMRKNRPPQQNGYCSYLEKGDWELYLEDDYKITYHKLGKTEMVKGKDILEETGTLGLLWDQCKECGINDELTP